MPGPKRRRNAPDSCGCTLCSCQQSLGYKVPSFHSPVTLPVSWNRTLAACPDPFRSGCANWLTAPAPEPAYPGLNSVPRPAVPTRRWVLPVSPIPPGRQTGKRDPVHPAGEQLRGVDHCEGSGRAGQNFPEWNLTITEAQSDCSVRRKDGSANSVQARQRCWKLLSRMPHFVLTAALQRPRSPAFRFMHDLRASLVSAWPENDCRRPEAEWNPWPVHSMCQNGPDTVTASSLFGTDSARNAPGLGQACRTLGVLADYSSDAFSVWLGIAVVVVKDLQPLHLGLQSSTLQS